MGTIFWIGLLGTRTSASIFSSEYSEANSCCNFLQSSLGIQVSFPNETIYVSSASSYYSNQEAEIKPECVVLPSSARDVSVAVGILSREKCRFAVKSGGHTPWAGAANLERGITIDLSSLNQIDVSEDRTVTAVGPGNRWVNVYSKLDAMGLSVPGGRVASVGVGGLTTGGGISFFGPRFGFVCDNVVNFEVVLATGHIINANASSHTKLFRSLKGGSNNLGIVTRIDLKTFTQSDFWGGGIAYPITAMESVLTATANFANASNYDPYSALITSYTRFHNATANRTTWLIYNYLHYTKPIAFPVIFQPFTTIEPQLFNTFRTTSLSEFTREMDGNNPYGRRQMFYTSTYRVDRELMSDVFDLANVTAALLGEKVPGLLWSLIFQPMPRAMTRFGKIAGGNVLGLAEANENLIVASVSLTWDDVAFDQLVENTTAEMFAKADAIAEERGLLNRYKYLNYAFRTQDPMAGYGQENVEFLRGVSRAYDPEQVFQKLVPGGFKLF